ncbi:MAG: inositol monophosphatase family protein [Candidatus Micrarchaeota archaeon]
MRRLDNGRMVLEMEKCFRKVRRFLNTKGRLLVEEKMANPRKPDQCDVTMGFDYEAEWKAIEHFDRLKIPMRILTEERGVVELGSSAPEFTLVMDPTDGSTNYKRGIESTAFSVALVPEGQPISPRYVEAAFIGSVWSGNTWVAVKGVGASRNSNPCRASSVSDISEALIGMDLDFNMGERWKWARVMPVIERCHMIRRGGAASLDAAYVAHGGYDAIIDVRDKSTPENFMAAYLIIKEAGGLLTDPLGNELPEMSDLGKKYNWVGSGNPALHEKIIRTLDMGSTPG